MTATPSDASAIASEVAREQANPTGGKVLSTTVDVGDLRAPGAQEALTAGVQSLIAQGQVKS